MARGRFYLQTALHTITCSRPQEFFKKVSSSTERPEDNEHDISSKSHRKIDQNRKSKNILNDITLLRDTFVHNAINDLNPSTS